MTTDIDPERRLRRAAQPAEAITAETVIARVHRRRRRHRLLAGGLATAVALVAGVVAAVTIPNRATSVSVATGPNSSRVPPIVNTSKVTIRLTPASAAPGTVIHATLAADPSVARTVTADYLTIQTWTGTRWKPLYFASLTSGQTPPTDTPYRSDVMHDLVGLGASTFRMKVPTTLPTGTYRLALSVSTRAAGARQTHTATAYTRLKVTGAAPTTSPTPGSASAQNPTTDRVDACKLLSPRQIDAATGWTLTAGRHLSPEPTAPASKRTSLCGYGERSHGLVEIATVTDGTSLWSPQSPGGGPGTRSRLHVAGQPAVAWTATHVQVVDFLLRGDYITVTVYDQSSHPRPGAAITIAKDLAPRLP